MRNISLGMEENRLNKNNFKNPNRIYPNETVALPKCLPQLTAWWEVRVGVLTLRGRHWHVFPFVQDPYILKSLKTFSRYLPEKLTSRFFFLWARIVIITCSHHDFMGRNTGFTWVFTNWVGFNWSGGNFPCWFAAVAHTFLQVWGKLGSTCLTSSLTNPMSTMADGNDSISW